MGNTASVVPYGAQSSLVYSAPICLTAQPNNVGSTYQGDTTFIVSATAPLSGASGQQVYFSDINGQLEIGYFISKFAADLNSTQYRVKYSIVFDTTDVANARALSAQAFTLNGNATGPWSNATISVPSVDGVAGPFGPVKLGVPGSVTDFRFVNMTLDVTYVNQFDDSLSQTYSTVCGESQFLGDNYPRWIISSTFVDNSTASTTPLAPSIGSPGKFNPVARGQKTSSANLPVTCKNLYNELVSACAERDQECSQLTAIQSTSNAYNLSFTGTAPAIYFSRQLYNISNVQTVFTVPPDAVTRNTEPGTYGYGFTLGKGQNGEDLPGPGLGLTLDNSSPSPYDVARSFTSPDLNTSNPLSTGRYVNNQPGFNESTTFPFPLFGDLVLANFTAVDFPRVPSVSVSNIQGNVYVYDVDRERGVGDFGISCTVGPNALLRAAIYT